MHAGIINGDGADRLFQGERGRPGQDFKGVEQQKSIEISKYLYIKKNWGEKRDENKEIWNKRKETKFEGSRMKKK